MQQLTEPAFAPTKDYSPRPELLAPAGDWDAMRAAVANGADAVYFGLNRFNARYRAANFTLEELPEVMAYLHGHNVRGYVAFNTLIFSDELPDALRFIKDIAAAGVDAVIVQDLGLASLIVRMYPGLAVHGSTQMTLTEPLGIEFVRQIGVQRVILARELSADDVRKIHAATDMPIEVFIHGALCVSYSGQCLTSEALGGRSANRGQCAQACRLPYELIVDGVARDLGDKSYLLSPQDLAAYDIIRELADAGICSFKIEGRLKSAQYVAATTQAYRSAIDAMEKPEPFVLPRQQELELAQSFSRGFTHGFLDGVNHQRLVHAKFPKSRGVKIGSVVATLPHSVIVELATNSRSTGPSGFAIGGELTVGDGIVFDEGHPEQDEQGGRIASVIPVREPKQNLHPRARQTPVPHSRKVELTFERGSVNFGAVAIGATVWKTDDPAIRRRLQASYARDRVARRVPLSAEVQAVVGQKLTVQLADDAGHAATVSWDQTLQTAQKFPLTEALFREQFGRMGDTPFELATVRGLEKPSDAMVPKSVLNDLRRQAVASIISQRSSSRTAEVAEADVLANVRREIRQRFTIDPLTPSPGTPGEGWGGSRSPQEAKGPHPNPPPAYREREQEPASRIGGTDIPVDFERRADDIHVPPSRSTPLDLVGMPAAADSKQTRMSAPPNLQNAASLYILVRTLDQLQAVLEWRSPVDGTRPATVYCDFEDVRKYKAAVALRSSAMPIGLATVRIIKPTEQGLLRQVADCEPDFVLIRNLAGIGFYSAYYPQIPLVADYSLNISNEATAALIAGHGVRRMTPSYDLSWKQLSELLKQFPATLFEQVVHQHMPMFHMEHCVFAHTLSTGTDFHTCGRPCETHQVDLRDRAGAAHPLIPDVGCRNTVFNAAAQSAAEYIGKMRELGLRHFRIELLREGAANVAPLLDRYARVIAGAEDGKATWRQLKVLNQLGVTRGTLGE